MVTLALVTSSIWSIMSGKERTTERLKYSKITKSMCYWLVRYQANMSSNDVSWTHSADRIFQWEIHFIFCTSAELIWSVCEDLWQIMKNTTKMKFPLCCLWIDTIRQELCVNQWLGSLSTSRMDVTRRTSQIWFTAPVGLMAVCDRRSPTFTLAQGWGHHSMWLTFGWLGWRQNILRLCITGLPRQLSGWGHCSNIKALYCCLNGGSFGERHSNRTN